MMKISTITLMAVALTGVGCDPLHFIKLENTTNQDIEVLIGQHQYMADDRRPGIEFEYRNRQVRVQNLKPNEDIVIGTVVARYSPRKDNLETDFLEIRMPPDDTIIWIGKNAIFSQVQKYGTLNWRIKIK